MRKRTVWQLARPIRTSLLTPLAAYCLPPAFPWPDEDLLQMEDWMDDGTNPEVVVQMLPLLATHALSFCSKLATRVCPLAAPVNKVGAGRRWRAAGPCKACGTQV